MSYSEWRSRRYEETEVIDEDDVSAWIVGDDLTLNQCAYPTRAAAIDGARRLVADIAMGRGAYAASFGRGTNIPGTPPGTSVIVTIQCVWRHGGHSGYMDFGATRTPGKPILSSRSSESLLDSVDELLGSGWVTMASDAVLRRVPATALPVWRVMLEERTPIACYEAASEIRWTPGMLDHNRLSLSDMASAAGEAVGIWSAARQRVSRYAETLEAEKTWEMGK